MNTSKINTVGTLIKALQAFDKTLPVAIFDSEVGYMSVAFKKEQQIKNNKTFQWLTFYAHETLPMYTIETLISYLNKLPKQAPICKESEEGLYTPLFLSLDGMKENKKTYQWLVISDELEYDRFFRKTEPSCLNKALEKMLLEVQTETTDSIERIHQWLCKQTNEELFKGILTEGKTIKEII